MKKILLVEDMEVVHDYVKEALTGKVEITSAFTIQEAEDLFQKNSDFDAIIVDVCVSGEELNTLPMVHELRKKYNGLMIVISKYGDYQKQLVDAGCDDRCKNKRQLPEFLTELLQL